ncbi:unnamed protein product, partial [Closterium sp. Naga37s-1]
MARPHRIASSQLSAFLLFLLAAAFSSCSDARIRIPRFPGSFHRQQKIRASAHVDKIGNIYNEVAASGASARGGYAWNVSYFTQNLDHFSFTQSSYATWQQKYIWWDGAWGGAESGAPIFVYCGNEGPIQWFMDNAGWIREIAVEFGALVVGPEHRYYGESMPFGSEKESFSNASTRAFLTTEQAMADMALFLTALRANLSAHDSPIILFGGSYGGMLAAWFRLKYPHIAAGAIAASAPILQYEDIVPSDTFYRIVSHDFKIESESCFEAIKSSWAAVREEAAAEGGLTRLSHQFHLCSPLTDADDLISWLETAYIYMAMVDYPVPSDFLMPLPAHPIRELCRRVDSLPASASLLDRIVAGVGVYYNYSGAEACFSVGDTDPHDMSNGWDFQACTEHVMPMSSNASNSLFEPFEWNQTAFEENCLQQYGVPPRPTWAMTQFGGRSIRSALRHFASNIVFSQGALDPWSGGGVLEDISDTLVSLTIPDGAHHLDLRASTPADPPSVRKQRKEEKKHIQKWIKQWHKDREEAKKHGRNGLRFSLTSPLVVSFLPSFNDFSRSLPSPVPFPFAACSLPSKTPRPPPVLTLLSFTASCVIIPPLFHPAPSLSIPPCSSLPSFEDISSTSLALFILSLALLATSVAVSLSATRWARPIGTTYSPALRHPLMGERQGNEYKSFETLDEARSYLALPNVSSPFTQPAEAPSHAFMPAAAATADPYTSASSNYSFTPSAAAPATAAITLFPVATGVYDGAALSFLSFPFFLPPSPLHPKKALYRMEFDGASKDRSAYSTPSSSQRAFSLLLHASSNPPQALYRMEFDGASKGNPGRAGAGSVLRDEHGNELVCMKEGVGHGTCNMAEYRAFIGGVERALALGITRLHVQGDSMLVVMQVQGKWKVNAEMLWEPCRQAQQLVCRFREIAIRHVPR